MPISVTRSDIRFLPDPRRVITKPFVPGGDARIQGILSRILALPSQVVSSTLASTYERFSLRHADLTAVLERSFEAVAHRVAQPAELSGERRRLIGAYFVHEYSIEAAALSNPSMVAAPNQAGVPPDAVRFVMSLRAIGEGHVSSIEFRTGVMDARGQLVLDALTPLVAVGHRRAPIYEKNIFRKKLEELHSFNETAGRVLARLPEHFTIQGLEQELREVERASGDNQGVTQATRTMHWLASSNYETTFDSASDISERVLFPSGPTESNGMEDARFVRFTHYGGKVTYFAPYTAFDGYNILPQLIETRDFVSFRIATLNGPCAANKGIALFPRKVDGRFMALARLDNEHNHLIWSDNIHFWHESATLQGPEAPWELTQIGNCGSPLETKAGWLVITHGVGPFRQYALGAILLDLDDPTRVIGRLAEPLLVPEAAERDGYVPNVVYSCGSMIFRDRLVVPYGFSDVGARIATVRLDDLLSELS